MNDPTVRGGLLFIREAAIDRDGVPRDSYLRDSYLRDSYLRDSYLRDIPTFKGFERLAFDSNVASFAGENGTGKSTLLEGIAVASGYDPEDGIRPIRCEDCV